MPRAGLGNKLLVWARAYAFAQTKQLPLYVSPWEQLKIGHILRKERDPRLYTRYFEHGQRAAYLWHLWRARQMPQVVNPAVDQVLLPQGSQSHAYVFRWRVDEDFFLELKPHREMIQEGLLAMILPRHKRIIHDNPTPCIGIHVRRGDFTKPQTEAEFHTSRYRQTPLTYFEGLIHQLRAAAGSDLAVSIFSDARPEELYTLLRLPNVRYAATNSAIADMLLLSRSRVIVLSADSTFGLIAAFLSEAAVILHPKNAAYPTRNADVNARQFEGAVSSDQGELPALLVESVKALSSKG